MLLNTLIINFILFCTCFAAEPLTTPPSPPAPDWTEKARALWNDGLDAYQAGQYRKTIQKLEILLDQFPTDTHALESKYYLGQSYFQTSQWEVAVKKLQEFIEVAGISPLLGDARLYLGDSYIQLKKFTEAFLVSEEIVQMKSANETLKSKALFLRAQARLGLKQLADAEKSLLAFQSLAENDPELERQFSESHALTLKLKAEHCSRIPGENMLKEEILLQEIEKKSLCVMEMGVSLIRAAKRLEGKELPTLIRSVQDQWNALKNSCLSPPLDKGKLAPKLYEKAKQELSVKLVESCENTRKLLTEAFDRFPKLKSVGEKLQMK